MNLRPANRAIARVAVNSRVAFAACLVLLLLPQAGYGEVWNLVDDFSGTQNPNGAWTYGWRTTPQQPLIVYTERGIRCGAPGELENWDHYIQDYTPRVTRNPQDYAVYCDLTVFAPHTVNFHPGPQQQSVVRFTAPSDAAFALTVHFVAIYTGSSIVSISENGTSLFTATLDHLGQAADYAATLALRAGDVIDCAVDPISFIGDSVQLDEVLESAGPTAASAGTWGRVKSIYR